MAEIWGNPATWSQQQWLAVVIMMFVVIASFVLVLRLYSIVRAASRPTYKPNLRRLRHNRPASAQDAGQAERDS